MQADIGNESILLDGPSASTPTKLVNFNSTPGKSTPKTNPEKVYQTKTNANNARYFIKKGVLEAQENLTLPQQNPKKNTNFEDLDDSFDD